MSAGDERMTRSRWALAGLAAIQLADAALCLKPVGFIARCLEDVRFPRRYWWTLTPLKLAASAGLIVGVRFKPLAALTAGCLVAYFVVAIGMHVKARDLGRNLFVNAVGMLVLSAGTLSAVFAVE